MSSIIQYTARRSLIGDHVAGDKYEIAVDITIDSLQTTVQEVKYIERSPGGGMEQGLERIDRSFPFTLTLASGTSLLALREFLDSTESGETFKLWTCDDGDSPRESPYPMKRLDEGHTEIPFIRRGRLMDDVFSINLVGLIVGTVDADGDSVDSDGSDIYDETSDPDGTGTGGFNPGPGGAPSTNPHFVAGELGSFVFGYSTDGSWVSPVNGPQNSADGSLIDGTPTGALGFQVIRDRLNFAFPFQIAIRAAAVASPETNWFNTVDVQDSLGATVTGGNLTVGVNPPSGFYDFTDSGDLGGGIHEYVWRWQYFSSSIGPLLADGTEYYVDLIL